MPVKNDTVNIVPIKYEELYIVDEICKGAEFSLGLYHKQVCFKYNSQRWWFVVDKNGTKFGVIIGHPISDEYYLRYLSVFNKEFRHKGFMDQVKRLVPPMPKNPQVILVNCNQYSLPGFCRDFSGSICGPKFLIHEGELTLAKLQKLNLTELPKNVQLIQCQRPEMLNFAKEYDHKIHKLDRSEFLDLWCGEEAEGNVVTFVAVQNETECVGYSSLCYDDLSVTSITPCYAESVHIAMQLMVQCWSYVFKVNPSLQTYRSSVYYPAKHRELVQLCKAFNWRLIHTDFKLFHGGVINIPFENVFAVHEYFII